MNTETFVAAFCPNCGSCVNEPDFDIEELTTTSPGSAYTCGWCKLRTTDWNHVKRCRATARLREVQKRSRDRVEQIADLVEMREELQYA